MLQVMDLIIVGFRLQHGPRSDLFLLDLDSGLASSRTMRLSAVTTNRYLAVVNSTLDMGQVKSCGCGFYGRRCDDSEMSNHTAPSAVYDRS